MEKYELDHLFSPASGRVTCKLCKVLTYERANGVEGAPSDCTSFDSLNMKSRSQQSPSHVCAVDEGLEGGSNLDSGDMCFLCKLSFAGKRLQDVKQASQCESERKDKTLSVDCE